MSDEAGEAHDAPDSGRAEEAEKSSEVDISEELRREIRAFAKQLPDMDYYAVLGIERGAGPDDIRKAFFQRSKKFHPDRYFNRNLGSYAGLLNEIYKRVVAAHEVIRDEKLRKEYDRAFAPSRPKPQAAPETAEPAAEPTPEAEAAPPAAPRADESAEKSARPAASKRRAPTPKPGSKPSGRSLRARSGFRSRSTILQELESRLAASRKRAIEHFKAAEERAEEGDWPEAVHRVRVCLAFDPRERKYHDALADWVQRANAVVAQRVRKLADRLLRDGQVMEALPHLDEAVRLCPTDARLARQLAFSLLTVGKELDRALEFAGRAVELEVDDPAHYKLRARVYMELGSMREARKDLQKAWELDPMDKDVKAALAGMS